MTKFSVRLKEIRNSRGKTQAETAEYLGFKSLRGYQLYEDGKNDPTGGFGGLFRRDNRLSSGPDG